MNSLFRCALCFKKFQYSQIITCLRCNQCSCKQCFKFEKKGLTVQQKNLFEQKSIGRCCIQDILFCSNLQINNNLKWCGDSDLSYSWLISIQDNKYYEYCLNLAKTKYAENLDIKQINKDIYEENVYDPKNLNTSFGEILAKLQQPYSNEEIKQNQNDVLQAFICYMLERNKIIDKKVYVKGHGMLVLFLLCFSTCQRAFSIMKDIYTLLYPEAVHPHKFKFDENIQYIVRMYVDNFHKKKAPLPNELEKIIEFTRKYISYQYNYFLLNQLNFSTVFVILNDMLQTKNFEVFPRALATIIQINFKKIIEISSEENIKDIIFNQVQHDIIKQSLDNKWVSTLTKDEINIVIEEFQLEYYNFQKNKYKIGAEDLDKQIKEIIRKDKQKFKIMEEHYLKQQQDYKNTLSILMKQLEENKNKLIKVEVQKNNLTIQNESLTKKIDIQEVDYLDLQNKLRDINEKVSKELNYFSKETDSQVQKLKEENNMLKQDLKKLEQSSNLQINSLKDQLSNKDTIINQLKKQLENLQIKTLNDNNNEFNAIYPESNNSENQL